MNLGRRGFLKAASVASAGVLAGCVTSTGAVGGDGGVPPCPSPPATTPPALDYPPPAYFEQLSLDLHAAGIGTPVVLIDVDRMMLNIDAIVTGTGSLSYRIVEKSLPSLDLLRHVSERSGSTKFMVLHLPFLSPLLAAIPAATVLVGKTHVTDAVASFFRTQPAGTDLTALAGRVTFLADDEARLADLMRLGDALHVPLRVAIELDVGLRRSGTADPAEVGRMLARLSTTLPGRTQFAGFMGYDGHVAYAPESSTEGVWSRFETATARYEAGIAPLADFPSLAALPDLVFNSGGSATFPMYTDGRVATPVNDVSAGGGVLRPGDYPNYVIGSLRPAIFIATPVLRYYASPWLPFIDDASPRVLGDRVGFTLYGGGWPAFFTYPPDLRPAPFVSDPADPAMVPNQGLVTAPAATDPMTRFAYYHPRQSDALFQFEEILLVQGGRLQTSTMAAYPRRY